MKAVLHKISYFLYGWTLQTRVGAIMSRELGSFFNSLVGYLAVAVFLIGVGLFFWVFGDNVLLTKEASMDPLFFFGPWFFLFLIPAITMRSFSEEFKTGTIEFLATKPLKDWEIILGKFLAANFVVLLSLLPTLVYYFTLKDLAASENALDTGSILGAYIGLFALGSIFSAIGLFASSISQNQVIAFILALFLCFFFYYGFDFLSQLDYLVGINTLIEKIGINAHYESISLGVIDTRDILYFVSVLFLFNYLTYFFLSLRKRGTLRKGSRNNPIVEALLVGLIVFMVNLFGQQVIKRIDLTEDGRFTVSDVSKELVSGLDKKVKLTVYFTGEMPTYYKKLEEGVATYLFELENFAGGNLEYQFIDPEGKLELFDRFNSQGSAPFVLPMEMSISKTQQQIVLPYIEVSYDERLATVNLVKGCVLRRRDGQLDIDVYKAVRQLEYELISTIYNMSRVKNANIGLLTGHEEYPKEAMSDLYSELDAYYNIISVDIRKGRPLYPADLDVLLVLQPQSRLSEREKFEIDQYLMRGGSVILLMDMQIVDYEIGDQASTLTTLREVRLDDLLLKHGIKMNYDLIASLVSGVIDVASYTSTFGSNQNARYWIYHPLIRKFSDHPTTRYLSDVLVRYASSIDTLPTPGIKKTVLLETDRYSKRLNGRQYINIDQTVRKEQDPRDFGGGPQKVAVLLEGQFQSLFQGRRVPGDSLADFAPKDKPLSQSIAGVQPKLLVVSDGELATGEILKNKLAPLPAGNKTFLMNVIDNFTGQDIISELRIREFVARDLDRQKVAANATNVQIINVALPVLILIIFGVLRFVLRRRKNRSYRQL